MDFYDEMRAVADEMLVEFGQSATLIRPGAVTGDPWNETQGSDEEYSVTIAVLAYAARDIDGTMIQSSDRRILMSAEGLDVEPQDSVDDLVVGDETLEIVSVKRVAPAGLTVMYELQCRG